ncbi:methyltransferase domain-containing protein [Maribacter sp. 2307ULW6-5]|uniref:methyltransferase domain-containing protein n=1 Tax=Maribacter sp. 2307ULW6-5 TaxID=3386275 RepID=UPI0039BD5524
MKSTKEEQYWTTRYRKAQTGWDIGYPSTPIKTYVDQLKDKDKKILIPGAGNAHEATYLWKKGFTKVYVLDISKLPLENFKRENPSFPQAQLLHENFFDHQGQYDLVLEQTFFCSFRPTRDNRSAYAKQMAALIRPKGKLVGLWFNFALSQDMENPPFGGHKEEYLGYLAPYFKPISFETAHNSIAPRQGKELFGIFERK